MTKLIESAIELFPIEQFEQSENLGYQYYGPSIECFFCHQRLVKFKSKIVSFARSLSGHGTGQVDLLSIAHGGARP